jgi:photosystem II stability/assembly factor-like uncharacterized protein
VVDPGDDQHILIGAANGGIWETTDGGDRWHPRSDFQPTLATGALCFDPSNPSVVYAGTGEGDFFSRLGTGLLRSNDGGTSWNLLTEAPFVGLGFYDIVVDPLNGQHLLAATTDGLFGSTDGGGTWTRRRTARTWDLSMHPVVIGDPNSTDEVFAACRDGLRRSTNGGTSWNTVTLPGAPANFTRIEVCHAPSDGDIVYVFAAGTTGSGHLWRRDAFAGAFTAITPPASLRTGQAWYDWCAAVAPNNPDILYLGEIDIRKGVRSATGSWSWATISAQSGGLDSIHPDQHHITFSPTDPNVVYVGNDGGIYRSPNGGTDWDPLNKGLGITEFEYLAQHPQHEAYVLGGTQDNGTQRYEGEEVWYHVQDGDGGDCGLNAATPGTCYHTFFGMGMEKSTTGGAWGSWSWIGPNPPANYNALFYPPLEVRNDVLAQAGETVYISRNNGASWINHTLPVGSGVGTALAIPTATRVYVGTNSGNIYRTDFSSGVWQAAVQLARPRAGFVSDLLVDPIDPNRIWATYSNIGGSHVFRSDDSGTSWNEVSSGLPNIPVNAIEVDPTARDTVWVAADVGVYRSTDAGASWQAFNNGLPNALAKDLLFHASSRLLRVATQSRGVWEINVDQETAPQVEVYMRDSVVDTGRTFPSQSGVQSPFTNGVTTHWWQCTDIKADAPTYQQPVLADVDFEIFNDDHGVFFAGLTHENGQRNRKVRVYVHLHNRGPIPAQNAAVKVFFADASLGLPDLPTNFWTNFPNNSLPSNSPWKAIAAHEIVPLIETECPQVVGFEWQVPATAASHTCLLAVVSSENDPVTSTDLVIHSLVRNSPHCSLKNLTIVNPPPRIGPRIWTIFLNLWGTRATRLYHIAVDRSSSSLIRGIILSRDLSAHARAERVKTLRLTGSERLALKKVARADPLLARRYDLTRIYSPPQRGVWLKDVPLRRTRPESMIVLTNQRVRRGAWSFLQTDRDGMTLGGYTLRVD